MSPPRAMARLLLTTMLAIFIGGCGPSGPKLYPVKGTVLFQGKPAEGATVVFQPEDSAASDKLTPSGSVDALGTFTLSTFPHGPGAPAGSYVVLVTWLPADARTTENAKNKLPARYADPTKKLLTATIKAGSNELPPFDLGK